MVMTKARNRRWEEVEEDTIELSVLARHFELYNRTEGKSTKITDGMTLRQSHRFLFVSRKSIKPGDPGGTKIREFILHLQERKRWQGN